MNEEERKKKVSKAAERIVRNLEQMGGYDKRVYIGRLINMLDDMHLIALDFAIEMTPDQTKREGGQ